MGKEERARETMKKELDALLDKRALEGLAWWEEVQVMDLWQRWGGETAEEILLAMRKKYKEGNFMERMLMRGFLKSLPDQDRLNLTDFWNKQDDER